MSKTLKEDSGSMAGGIAQVGAAMGGKELKRDSDAIEKGNFAEVAEYFKTKHPDLYKEYEKLKKQTPPKTSVPKGMKLQGKQVDPALKTGKLDLVPSAELDVSESTLKEHQGEFVPDTAAPAPELQGAVIIKRLGDGETFSDDGALPPPPEDQPQSDQEIIVQCIQDIREKLECLSEKVDEHFGMDRQDSKV